MSEIDRLRDEMDRLEVRLANYHQNLEDALDHNHVFQLKATWGILTGAYSLGALALLIWGVNKCWTWAFGTKPGMFAGIPIMIDWMVVTGYIGHLTEKNIESDRKKLWRWPRWYQTEG